MAQFQDHENGGGHREGAAEHDHNDGAVARGEEAEVGENEGEPENQHDQKGRGNREIILRLLDEQPAGLRDVVHDLARPGEQFALVVGLRREQAEFLAHGLHAGAALDGGEDGHAGVVRGPEALDGSGEGLAQFVADGLGVRAVIGEHLVQVEDFGAGLDEAGVERVVGAFGGADEQAEDERGEGRDDADAQLDGVVRFLVQVMLGQKVLQLHAEQKSAKHAARADDGDEERDHEGRNRPVLYASGS